ncbi:hypothetical protein EDB86DRAFT_2830895 [Lactarius hatsudake]|nr:hypothetical protein EDB86DRAFT_2830895 [Lactarius hatsudake]
MSPPDSVLFFLRLLFHQLTAFLARLDWGPSLALAEKLPANSRYSATFLMQVATSGVASLMAVLGRKGLNLHACVPGTTVVALGRRESSRRWLEPGTTWPAQGYLVLNESGKRR